MNLTLVTKLLFLALLTTVAISGQTVSAIEQNSIDSLNSKEKKLTLNIGFYKPFTTNSSFIGEGTKGQGGFDIGMQVFVYKNFFIGAFAGYFFLDVTNTNLVGDYRRSRAFNAAIELGYEHSLSKKIDIGASIAPLGYTEYRNYISDGRVRQQRDNASSIAYRTYVNYQFSRYFAFFINYSFRNDTTKIETAPEIQNNFNEIQYHNVGFGLRILVY
ncbi:hypothetical protein OAB88_03830 [Winogradskyella sp.]|nr:hypothetical protein [Winogradskyella sp.]MDC1505676.1 hypothetical protein [Winogradskyella sp.]